MSSRLNNKLKSVFRFIVSSLDQLVNLIKNKTRLNFFIPRVLRIYTKIETVGIGFPQNAYIKEVRDNSCLLIFTLILPDKCVSIEMKYNLLIFYVCPYVSQIKNVCGIFTLHILH